MCRVFVSARDLIVLASPFSHSINFQTNFIRSEVMRDASVVVLVPPPGQHLATAKEYDEFRMSPDYLAYILEIKHYSSFPPPDDPIVFKNTEDEAASPVYKGMVKISDLC
jgi:hypothetical protein